MKANSALTRVTCAGIVDADDHSPVDKALLAASNVSVLPVSEIENLFLLPAVLAAIADQEALDTTAQDSRMNALAEEIVTSTSDKVIKSNVSRYLRRRIDRTLKLMDLSGAQDAQAIALEYSQKTGSLDIADLSTVYEAKLRTALSDRDLISIAKLLDDKGLITSVAKHFRNTSKTQFEAWIMRMVGSSDQPAIRLALQSELPTITPH
jgi:hypothetical protein